MSNFQNVALRQICVKHKYIQIHVTVFKTFLRHVSTNCDNNLAG